MAGADRPGRQHVHAPLPASSRFALINSVTSISRSDYGNSAKITRLAVDNASELATYYAATRSVSMLTQSEELATTEQPLDHPLYGRSSI